MTPFKIVCFFSLFVLSIIFAGANEGSCEAYLRLEETSVDFGTLTLGQPTIIKNMTFFVQAGTVPWYVSMRSTPLINRQDGITPFQHSNYTYWFDADYAGTETPHFGQTAVVSYVPDPPADIYIPALGECESGECGYRIKLSLTENPLQMAGSYSGTITFTLATRD